MTYNDCLLLLSFPWLLYFVYEQVLLILSLKHLCNSYQWKLLKVPRLVWLSGLSTGLHTKGSLVRFPVRAHAWVVGQVPSGGRARGNHTITFLSSFSLPSTLSKTKKRKKERKLLKGSFTMLIQPLKSYFGFSVKDGGEKALCIVPRAPWNPLKTTKRIQKQKSSFSIKL